jgi:hypothetical protein
MCAAANETMWAVRLYDIGNTAQLIQVMQTPAKLQDALFQTVMAWVELKHPVKILHILLFAGARADAEDADGKTPLYLLALYGGGVRTTVQAARLLVKHGAKTVKCLEDAYGNIDPCICMGMAGSLLFYLRKVHELEKLGGSPRFAWISTCVQLGLLSDKKKK